MHISLSAPYSIIYRTVHNSVKKRSQGRGSLSLQGTSLRGKTGFEGGASRFDSLFEGSSHGGRSACDGNGGVDETGIRSEFHGFCGVTRCADAGIHNDGDGGLFDDDLQEVTGAQSAVCANGCAEGHDGGGTGFFQVLAECGVGGALGQDDETHLCQLFCCLERLSAVGQEIARIGVDFKFQPVRAESFA